MTATITATTTTVPLIPESAPFSPEQRSWLNGFFAGLLGTGCGSAEPSPFGQTEAAAAETDRHGGNDAPWHDPALSLEERLELAGGRPLDDRLMAAMAQLDCGACGYVCKTYARALADGSERGLTRCAPGGKATAKAIRQILAELGDGNGANGSGNGGSGIDADVTTAAPARAKLAFLRSERLTAATSDKETVLVSLDLTASGLRYEVGDALAILPRNSPREIERVLRALGAKGDEATDDGPLAAALESARDIRTISNALLDALREAAAGEERVRLDAMLAGEDDWPLEHDVAELFAVFPRLRVEPRKLVSCLEPIRPRLYSIASSPAVHGEELHLTVAVVRYRLGGRERTGLASTFLAERCRTGDAVEAHVHEAPHFRLPPDDAPLVMIGPGTGIAPFRAFLHERAARGASGPNWLFFGERRRATDFLFREELAALEERGVLARLSTAFSRDQAEKVYVQDRLRESARELWSWLDDGAHIRVCGDARRMAVDVERALVAVAETEGGLAPHRARDWLRALTDSGRYAKDVY